MEMNGKKYRIYPSETVTFEKGKRDMAYPTEDEMVEHIRENEKEEKNNVKDN